MKRPRVVLDTNCLVSALLFAQGRLAWMRAGWQRGRFVPLVSRQTAEELVRVLAYPKFGLDGEQRETLLADFLPWAETVQVGHASSRLPSLRDPDDRMFLALAAAGKADALVTGDADLLAVKRRLRGTRVLTAAEFADWLGE